MAKQRPLKAPLWLTRPIRPGLPMPSLKAGWKFATSPLPKLTTPMQLGPISRILHCRARLAISACEARPCSPTSAKPEVNTTAARTRFSRHSRSTGKTAGAGTATIARSIAPGISVTRRWARRPWISLPPGLTGWSAPENPLAFMKAMGSPPILAASREAPMTATDAGLKRGSSEARSIASPPRDPLKASARAYAVAREIAERRYPLELPLEPAGQEQTQHVEVANQRPVRVDQRRGSIALEHQVRGNRDAVAGNHAHEHQPPGPLEESDQEQHHTGDRTDVVKGARPRIHMSAQVIGPEMRESVAGLGDRGHGVVVSLKSLDGALVIPGAAA